MRYNLKWDIVHHRNKFFAFSAIITILGIITLLIHGLNYGVDFKAGTNLDVSIGKKATKVEVQTLLKDNDFGTPKVTMGNNDQRATIRFDKVLKADEVNKIEKAFIDKYGKQVSKEENTVDADMAKELISKAIWAVAVASIFISIYVSIRFEWRYAVSAIISILHDAFIVVAMFSIFKLEVNLPFITAVLTIVGYSINDTIVIFDRIRENVKSAKIKTFEDLVSVVNGSIWQTMTRSINTVITVLVAALCLFIFGGHSIRLFSLAMIFGLVAGAYSSIFIASPIWVLLKARSLKKPAVVKE